MDQDRNPQAFKLAARHYLQQMRLDWRILLPGFLLPAVGGVLVFYAPPLIIAKVLTRFGQQSHPLAHDLWIYVILFAAVWAAGEASWRIGLHFIIKGQVRGMQRLYLQAMGYLFQKDLSFFHDNFAGALTKKVSDYGWRYMEVTDTLMFNIFSMYVPIIFAFFVLWHFSPWLVVTLFGLLSITGLVVFPLIKRRMRIVASREKAHNIMSGHIADTIGNMDAVKAFANEPLEIQSHEKFVRDFAVKAKKSWDYQNLRIEAVASPFYVLTNSLGLLLALTLSHGNATTLETVFISFSYFSAATRVIWEFSDTYRRLEISLTDAAQFTELLLEEPKLKDVNQPQPFKVTDGHIQMKDVAFKYHDRRGDHLFERFNLDIKSGEKVALVGHSGGGKSTITRLLLRFMDINQGAILFDGQDIAQVKQADLRRHVAYVPQEPSMFHRSLMDNIRYGRLAATNHEVFKAARLAHAAEFIEKLPNGYETLVGERGVKLSGGQRQRVAIARAILKDAPVLILDEATSSLDSESEKLIQDALWKLMEGRTTIVIAHRLSTIQRMDRIVVLEEGRIVEEGSHKELLSQDGVYANLWAHQSGGFLDG